MNRDEMTKEEALSAYIDAVASAWRAYDEAKAPAWRAYKEAAASAFVNAWFGQGKAE